ncbi:hypothetical protein TNCV_772841 [Trichonephila clavipes]|nr:hypothetical protein TNCV_772841 [Trichonephila clavipes]
MHAMIRYLDPWATAAPCTRDSAHKTFGPTNLTSTLSLEKSSKPDQCSAKDCLPCAAVPTTFHWHRFRLLPRAATPQTPSLRGHCSFLFLWGMAAPATSITRVQRKS